MLMMITCKLSGVAFEINNSYKRNDKDLKNSYNEDKIDPEFFDILHYTFSYFGMLVGELLIDFFLMSEQQKQNLSDLKHDSKEESIFFPTTIQKWIV